MGTAAVAPDDLAKRPGYRADAAGRAEDVTTAKQLWSAAFGDAPPPEIRVFAAGVPRSIPERALAALQRQYADALGVTLTPVVDSSGYAVIASSLGRNIDGATEGATAFTFMFEDGGVDIDELAVPALPQRPADEHVPSAGPAARRPARQVARASSTTTRAASSASTSRTTCSRTSTRASSTSPRSSAASRGATCATSQTPIWAGDNGWLASAWLDTTHPAWQGRPMRCRRPISALALTQNC